MHSALLIESCLGYCEHGYRIGHHYQVVFFRSYKECRMIAYVVLLFKKLKKHLLITLLQWDLTYPCILKVSP